MAYSLAVFSPHTGVLQCAQVWVSSQPENPPLSMPFRNSCLSATAQDLQVYFTLRRIDTNRGLCISCICPPCYFFFFVLHAIEQQVLESKILREWARREDVSRAYLVGLLSPSLWGWDTAKGEPESVTSSLSCLGLKTVGHTVFNLTAEVVCYVTYILLVI